MGNTFDTAIHEAGHAVIGRILSMWCGRATIVKDASSAGHAITRDHWDIWERWKKQEKYRDLDSVFVGRILTYMAVGKTPTKLICVGSPALL